MQKDIKYYILGFILCFIAGAFADAGNVSFSKTSAMHPGDPHDTLRSRKYKKQNTNFMSVKKFAATHGSLYSSGSSNNSGFVFWKLLSVSGELKGTMLSRREDRLTNDIYDTLTENNVFGGLQLKASSYFLNPNFMQLDVDGEYNPGSNRVTHIVVPDRTEMNSLKKFGLNADFFKNKNVNLVTFVNFDQSYLDRENITVVKSNNRQWGANLNFSNKVFPLSMNFSQRKWNQTDTATDRKFKLDEAIFRMSSDKSFSSYDKNNIEYSHNEYKFVNENDFLTYNKIDELSLNDKIYFDTRKKHYFNSMMSDYNHNGNFNFNRYQAFETLNLQLLKNLLFVNNYNFFYTNFDNNTIRQHNAISYLQHKLFESLTSKISFEYNNIKQTNSLENKYKGSIEFNYTKNIPFGKLALFYRYYRYYEDMNSNPLVLQITNEELLLNDNAIVLLAKPYVNLNSVVVKDVTNTIIYQLNLDYILVQHNNFVEVKRIPGGLIANNTTALVDYTATQPGDYSYTANGNFFSANVFLFKDVLDLYYRYASLDYSDLVFTDCITLNYLHQNLFGSKLNFGLINFGAEYDAYNSTIVPYKMTHYFINLQKNIKEKFLFAFSGNFQDYKLTEENVRQKFADATGMISYNITPTTKLSIDLTYRKQVGTGIDLDMYTAKCDISKRFRKLYLNLGTELYKRDYIGEKIKFRGMYFQVSRKF